MAKIVDREQKRADIAEKAIEVFAEKGFEKATIQDIAQKAAIAKGSVYQYFETKQDILVKITHDFLGGFEELMNVISSQAGNPPEKLKSLMLMSAGEIEGMENIMKVYMEIWNVNMRGGYGDMKKIFDEFLERMRDFLTEIIEEGVKRGFFRDDIDPRAIAVYLCASMDGIGLHYLFKRDAFNLGAVMNNFIDNLLRGISK